jgi:hypothetical protein
MGDDGRCQVWLERASGAKCYALSVRRISLPWDNDEYNWRWKTHPLSRLVIIFHDRSSSRLGSTTTIFLFGQIT